MYQNRLRIYGRAAAGAAALAALACLAVPSPALAEPVRVESGWHPGFADVVEKVAPTVASVRVTGSRGGADAARAVPGPEALPPDHPLHRFFRDFRRLQPPQGSPRGRPSSQGSGFFISSDGYMVTNHHVVDRGDEVAVILEDGTELEAEIVGSDPRTDLAVLKVDGAREFPYVAFADDSSLRVGEWVVAVGNPFGLGGTVTAGVVSARGRDIGAGPYDDFIQIDAAVNRGNSGGPAFNLRGEVVGVNTAIFSPSGGNVGIAFAIPASTAKAVVESLKAQGFVSRGWLGVRIQPVTAEVAESLGMPSAAGALVAGAAGESPAIDAGVRPGDVVTAINGMEVRSPRDLSRAVGAMAPGDLAALSLWSQGQRHEVVLALAEMPDDPEVAAGAAAGVPALSGFGLEAVPDGDGNGLVVMAVEDGSVAAAAGLEAGDVIESVNLRPSPDAEAFGAAVRAAADAGRKAVLMSVSRNGSPRFVAVPMPDS